MFKKNSWIVALLLALTLTALFTGCIDAVSEEGGADYTEVELGDFNIWGGQTYQRGWAVAGMKFKGVADKAEVAADKGYKNEDFAKATKLVIEMEDATHPNGNLDIIWGAADADGNSVGKDWEQTGGIKSTKAGNILTVDLTAMKGYADFKTGKYEMRKLVLQAGAEKAGLPFVKKATLLIPNKEEPIPPDEYAIPGSYDVPDGKTLDRSTLYVDLNGAYQGAMNKVFLKGKLEKDKLSFTFAGTDNRAGIYIPFDADFAKLVQAAADANYKINVTYDGTIATPTGKDKIQYRVFVTNNTTNNYAVSKLNGKVDGVLPPNATAELDGPADGSSAALPDMTLEFFNQDTVVKGLLFQMTNADAKATYEADGTTIKDPAKEPVANVEIKSIKFTFKAPAATPPGKITNAQTPITIDFPIAGWAPSSKITSTGVEGSVKYLPGQPFGKFERSTEYRAEITITPKAGIFIPLDIAIDGTNTVAAPGFVVKNAGGTTVAIVSYDPVKGIIYTGKFAATDAADVPNPIEGAYDGDHGTFTAVPSSIVVFDLQKYLTDNAATLKDGDISKTILAPIVKAGEPKIELLNKGLNITQGSGGSWSTIDFNLIGDNSLDLDLENKSYKITVWGNLNSAPGGGTQPTIHVPYTDAPWNSANLAKAASDGTSAPPTLTGLFEKFEVSATITPADWAGFGTANPGGAGKTNRVRIRLSDGGGANTPFRICSIIVEELP